ncbi:MAG: MalY/PatB family protein [Blastococcus sp.]
MTELGSGDQPPGFDALTEAALRSTGSLKWSRYGPAIGAFVAEMDFGTAPSVTRALHDAVDRGQLGYLPDAAAAEMARACAGWLERRYGWRVPPARITPLADVLAGLQAAIEHFSPAGSAVVLPTPAYMPFRTLPGVLGRELIEVPMIERDGRMGYDLDGLAAAFAAGGGLLVHCNPHNPLGVVFTADEQLALAEVVEQAGVRVFSDEIHAPLVYPSAVHRPYADLSPVTARHTVTATSASKAWNLPGLKAAQLVLSDEDDAARWAEVGSVAAHGASTLGVLAAVAAYDTGEAWLDGVLGYLDGNRRLLGDLLAAHLPEVRYTPPEGTYLAWLDCRELGIEGSVGGFFLDRAGVALVDGPECGTPGVGHVRLNLATPRPVLTRMVERMGAAVRSLRPAAGGRPEGDNGPGGRPY